MHYFDGLLMDPLVIPVNDQWVFGPIDWDQEKLPPDCQTLPDLLDHFAKISPDKAALVAGSSRLTYLELSDKSKVFAASLDGLGVTCDSRVGLLAPNIEDWLVTAFGAMRLGIALDTFNTWVLAWDLEHLLRISRTEVLITVSNIRSTNFLEELKKLIPELWNSEPGELSNSDFPHLKNVIIIGHLAELQELPSGALSYHELIATMGSEPCLTNKSRPQSTAIVLYTSGTTIRPKAVPLTHRKLIENGFAIGTRMDLTDLDRVWLSSPLFWSYGFANAVMATMTHGACLILQEVFTPKTAAEILSTERCTAAYLLPSMAIALIDEVGSKVREIASLRTGLTIGRSDEIKRIAFELGIPEICNIYGSTEVYGNCCVTSHKMPIEERILSQGPPLPGFELRVVDMATGNSLPPGNPGELQVRGRVMSGYLDDESASAVAFTDGDWFRTGDTCLINADGTLRFLSRHTDMIKNSGINVSPSEVEGFIGQHPSVESIVVVGAAHPTKGEVPVAFVVNRPGTTLSSEDLLAYCKGSIASFKIPWAVEFVSSIPHTSTGKIMRKDLRTRAEELVVQVLRDR